jgi:transposase-like protein
LSVLARFLSLRQCEIHFRYFNRSPEVIRFVVLMYIRYPLSLRQVEDILFERGIDICRETVRSWWHRLGVNGGVKTGHVVAQKCAGLAG